MNKPVTALLITLHLSLFALLTACNEVDVAGPEPLPVTLSANINYATRADGSHDQWTATDRIGVYMAPTGTSIYNPQNCLISNQEYSIDPQTGLLSPVDGTTYYYPQTGNVDIVAYYPYDGGLALPYVDIDLRNQSNPDAIDWLYARVPDMPRQSAPVGLTFEHVLSKVTFNISTENNVSAAEISAVTFNDMLSSVSLDLQNGSTWTYPYDSFNARKSTHTTSGFAATYTALLAPQPNNTTGYQRSLTITANGTTYIWNIPNDTGFQKNTHHTYTLTVKRDGIVIATSTNITKWNENPQPPGNATDLKAVRIPAGTFLMGSSDGSAVGTGTPGVDPNATPAEPNRQADETQHRVAISRDFLMGKYLVTYAEFVDFLNAESIPEDGVGSVTYSEGGNDAVTEVQPLVRGSSIGVSWATDKWEVANARYDNHPVVNVTWYGATAYAQWKSKQTGMTCQLPTEAQWEYACRGGYNNRPFGVGEGYELNNTHANFYWQRSWSWDGTANGATESNTGTDPGTTQPVGKYRPNAYGLYDMHGNVGEWCRDQWGDGDNYLSLDETDPLGTQGNKRILRGGSYFSTAANCRSAGRSGSSPDIYVNNFGFRVIYTP